MSPQTTPSRPSSGKILRRIGAAGAAEDKLLHRLEKKFRIIAQLGEGGTARVWLAMARGPKGFNKLVVLKTIRGELFDDPSVVDMFLEEARLAARLNHPHIVQTNEVFQEQRQPVIVMEYLEGVPFSVVLERQREGNALALAMLLRILSDGLAGLHAAHELQDYDGTPLSVVHRDVSPHNLFVTFTGQTKVLDFGIAQLSSKADLSQSGVIKGKLRYISPEQVSGERQVDRRADVYSMGVVLWEVATTQRMWSGIPEPTIMKRILSGDIPRLLDVNPGVDQELAAIIERALSAAPDHRYSTALDFQAELDRYMASLGGALRNRDIGRAVSKMFDDVRQERQATIEAQMARTDSLQDLQLQTDALPELTSFSKVGPPRSLRRFRLSPNPGALIVFALLAMSAFLLAVIWPNLSAPVEKDPRLPTVSVSPPDKQPTTPERIVLRLTAFPRGAKFLLDGKPLGSNPFVGRYVRDQQQSHQLVVEAAGHRSEKRDIVFATNQEIVLTLHPTDASLLKTPAPDKLPPATKRSAASRPPPAPQEPEEEKAKTPDCSSPYFYDQRGVKKYRPECL